MVKYKENVVEPFENTILTDIPFDFDLWSNLHPGIGIECIKTNFKEIFSLKFNYKWFFVVLLFCIAYPCTFSYFTNGKIYSKLQ